MCPVLEALPDWMKRPRATLTDRVPFRHADNGAQLGPRAGRTRGKEMLVEYFGVLCTETQKGNLIRHSVGLFSALL